MYPSWRPTVKAFPSLVAASPAFAPADALRSDLLVASSSTYLASQVEPWQSACFQRMQEAARVDKIILYIIARPFYFDSLETFDRKTPAALLLGKVPKTVGYTVFVDNPSGSSQTICPICRESAPPQPTRGSSADRRQLHRRPDIGGGGANCTLHACIVGVRLDLHVGLPAGRTQGRGVEERKRHVLRLGRLRFQRLPIDGGSVEAQRRPCLQSPERKAERLERYREALRGRLDDIVARLRIPTVSPPS